MLLNILDSGRDNVKGGAISNTIKIAEKGSKNTINQREKPFVLICEYDFDSIISSFPKYLHYSIPSSEIFEI